MTIRYPVQTAYTAQYPDPIVMQAGDRLRTDGREDDWDGQGHIWVWCIHPNGKVGWVPKSFLRYEADYLIATVDYSARELSAAVGDELMALQVVNGWAWCQHPNGDVGWIPVTHLVALP
jgi:hypothetical protein